MTGESGSAGPPQGVLGEVGLSGACGNCRDITMMLTYLFPQNAKFLQLLLHVTTPNPEFVRVGTPIVFRDGSAGAENLGVGVGVVTALCS